MHQSHLVEEPLVPYHRSLEVVGTPPPQLRRDRVAEAECDVPGVIDGRHVVYVALTHPEVQARVLAETGWFVGRHAVVQHGAGHDDCAADHYAGQSQSLAAETKQQRHRQHREIQEELRAVGDRHAPEQARHQAEPAGGSSREPESPVAGPERSQQERQRGRLGGKKSSVGDVQRPERTEKRGQGCGGRGEQQTRQPPREERNCTGERTPQYGPGPQSRPFRFEEHHGGGQQYVGPWRPEGVGPPQAGARGETLGSLDVPAYVRVDVIDGRVDHQPPHDPYHDTDHNGGQGDPVPAVHRHKTESRQVGVLTRRWPAKRTNLLANRPNTCGSKGPTSRVRIAGNPAASSPACR